MLKTRAARRAAVRALRATMLLLTLLALAPLANASATTVFSKTYHYNAIYTDATSDDAFTMIDPGGSAPVVCYYRFVQHQQVAVTVVGATGTITIRVVDGNGNLVFVDDPIGATEVGVNPPPVGLGGVTPGTWHVLIDVNGKMTATTLEIHVIAASSIDQCPASP